MQRGRGGNGGVLACCLEEAATAVHRLPRGEPDATVTLRGHGSLNRWL